MAGKHHPCFIDRDEVKAARQLGLIAAHIGFMDLVILKQIHDDGGTQEDRLLGALDEATRKLSKS